MFLLSINSEFVRGLRDLESIGYFRSLTGVKHSTHNVSISFGGGLIYVSGPVCSNNWFDSFEADNVVHPVIII